MSETTLYADGEYRIELWFRDGRYRVRLWGPGELQQWNDRAWFRRRSVGTLVRQAIEAMMADRERRQEALAEARQAAEEARQVMAIEAEVMQAVRAIEGRA